MILGWFLPYINMNQPYAYICPLSPESPITLPLPSHPHPSRLSESTDFGSAVSYKFPLPICFIHGNVYVSVLFSQIIPPSPLPTESKSLFFMSVPPLPPCMSDCQYHLSIFHIHVLIYNICLSLSDLVHSV